MSVLLILKPFAFILLTIQESVHAIPLTLTLNIFALINITVLKNGLSPTIRFTFEKFTLVFAAILKFIMTYFDFLRHHLQGNGYQQSNKTNRFIFQHFYLFVINLLRI